MYKNLFPNYNFFYVLPENSNIGGTGAYIHSSFMVNEINLNLNFNAKCGLNECMFLELTKGNYHCVLSTFYRHPNQNVSAFTDLLESIFQNATFSNKLWDYLIVGDTNINLLKYDSNTGISRFIDMLVGYDFQPLSVIPSRFSDSTATLIDHVFYRENIKSRNCNHADLCSGMLITDIADHLANFFILPSDKLHS